MVFSDTAAQLVRFPPTRRRSASPRVASPLPPARDFAFVASWLEAVLQLTQRRSPAARARCLRAAALRNRARPKAGKWHGQLSPRRRRGGLSQCNKADRGRRRCSAGGAAHARSRAACVCIARGQVMPRDEMRKASTTRPPCASRLAALVGSVARRPRSDRRAGPQSFTSESDAFRSRRTRDRTAGHAEAWAILHMSVCTAAWSFRAAGPAEPRRWPRSAHCFLMGRRDRGGAKAGATCAPWLRVQTRGADALRTHLALPAIGAVSAAARLRCSCTRRTGADARRVGTRCAAARMERTIRAAVSLVTTAVQPPAGARTRAWAAQVRSHGTGVRLILRSACAAPLPVLRAMRAARASRARGSARSQRARGPRLPQRGIRRPQRARIAQPRGRVGGGLLVERFGG